MRTLIPERTKTKISDVTTYIKEIDIQNQTSAINFYIHYDGSDDVDEVPTDNWFLLGPGATFSRTIYTNPLWVYQESGSDQYLNHFMIQS